MCSDLNRMYHIIGLCSLYAWSLFFVYFAVPYLLQGSISISQCGFWKATLLFLPSFSRNYLWFRLGIAQLSSSSFSILWISRSGLTTAIAHLFAEWCLLAFRQFFIKGVSCEACMINRAEFCSLDVAVSIAFWRSLRSCIQGMSESEMRFP